MAKPIVKWKPQKLLAKLDRDNMRRVMLALMYLKRKVRENINVPTATQGPSAPGEPPHKVRGDLQRSIFARGPNLRRGEVSGDVGTKLVYGIFHEFNPEDNPRSFLRFTTAAEQMALKTILTSKV